MLADGAPLVSKAAQQVERTMPAAPVAADLDSELTSGQRVHNGQVLGSEKLNKHLRLAVPRSSNMFDLEYCRQGVRGLALGPSGCGKLTTLRMIAGLEDATSGDIASATVSLRRPPRDRDIAMVFQNISLRAFERLYDNLAFGLRNKQSTEAEIKAAIHRAAGTLGLHELLQRKPKQLSGGQQQRVALGRGHRGRNPHVDEPLSQTFLRTRADCDRDQASGCGHFLHHPLGVLSLL